MPSTGTVVLSRQPLRPSGQCLWVKQSVAAVRWLKECEMSLATSVGLQTWELITFLGSVNDLKLNIYIPCANPSEFKILSARACNQFRLNDSNVAFTPVMPSDTGLDRRQIRDREIIRKAQQILPVSVRSGGFMAGLVDEASRDGKKVIRDFEVDYQSRRNPLAYKIEPADINPEVAKLSNQYLIHWTRTSNEAWPTETLFDYYQDIVGSDSYPRSAFHCLRNILVSNTIKASSKNMPGGAATVSLSGRPPSEMLELMSWRSRYRVMSFEPYGLGIDRRTALAMNVLPVIYYDKSEGSSESIGSVQRWRTQSRGVKSDWSMENEYRHPGDMHLANIPPDKLVAFCYTEREAEEINRETGIRALSMTLRSE